MIVLEQIIPLKLFDILDRNGISTVRQIILLSDWDIKKETNLSIEDIALLKNIVSENLEPNLMSCDQIYMQNNNFRVTTGCNSVDYILKGGLCRGKITEIYGESGSGKTQLGIQAAAYNWSDGCVYICTEDMFPVKRFDQVKKSLPNFCPDIDYGKNIFVEHLTEPHNLLSCIRVRVPKLLEEKNIALMVIDSVAAPFRVENTNYIQRAEDLRELAISLIEIALKYNIALICINQVTATFDTTSEDVIPSLGLAWSNMVNVRLWLKKKKNCYESNVKRNMCTRELSIEFAPDLPYSIAELVITTSGIESIK